MQSRGGAHCQPTLPFRKSERCRATHLCPPDIWPSLPPPSLSESIWGCCPCCRGALWPAMLVSLSPVDCGFILVLPASSPTLFLVQDQDQIQNSLLCSGVGGILVTLAVPDKNLRGSLGWGLCDVYSWVSWTCSALHSDDGLFLRCPRVLGSLLLLFSPKTGRVSMCSPGHPGTCPVNQAGLEFRDSPYLWVYHPHNSILGWCKSHQHTHQAFLCEIDTFP